MARYENNTSEQGIFLAIQLDDQYDENSREKIIKQFIQERVKLDDFDEPYDNDRKGRKIKNPKDVIAAIIYGYITGNRSSRKIEDLLKHHIGFMFVSNRLKIDHSVLCEFKIKFERQVQSVLSDLLFVLNEMGAIDWSIITGDGTKIKAYANKGKNIGKDKTERIVKTYKKLAEKIVKRDLELEESKEDKSVGEKEYQAEKERIDRQKKVYANTLQKIEEFQKSEDNRKKMETEYCNLTDPDSKLMLGCSHDHYIQGYNTILMSSNNDIIVDYETVTTPEKQHTKSLVQRVEKKKSEMNQEGIETKASKYLFDSGFQDMRQILELSDSGVDLYVDMKERDFSDKASKRKDFLLKKEESGYSLVCRGKRECKGNYNKKADQHTFWFYRAGCKGCEFYEGCYQT